MAYDEDLDHRIRELLGAEHGVQEKKMFGGLAVMLCGNMALGSPLVRFGGACGSA